MSGQYDDERILNGEVTPEEINKLEKTLLEKYHSMAGTQGKQVRLCLNGSFCCSKLGANLINKLANFENTLIKRWKIHLFPCASKKVPYISRLFFPEWHMGLPGFEPGRRGPKPRIIAKLDHNPEVVF